MKLVNLPEDLTVNGVDDLLVVWGPARVLELFDAATSADRLHVVLPPQFQSRSDGMFRTTNHGDRLSDVKLTNFRSAIITNLRVDDGVETKRELEIEAEILGQKSRFSMSAAEFSNMGWPVERLGAAAIVYPNQREYARTAIQSCSLTAKETCIYTHTGWRQIDGVWLYLHGGGAIGPVG